MRRCTQLPPIARQSVQPAISSGNSVTLTLSMCEHTALTAANPPINIVAL